MSYCNRRRAFTLVELLVVIGVIALLIAMLLPALRRARQQAIALSCLSNMRQAGMYAFMYANDNRDVIPMSWHQGRLPNGSYSEVSWPTYYTLSNPTRYADLANRKLSCPENAPGTYPFAFASYNAYPGEFSTLPHGIYLADPNDSFRFHGIKRGKLKGAVEYAMIADSASQDTGLGTTLIRDYPLAANGFGLTNSVGPGGQRRGVWIAHRDRANILFGDGHAAALTARQLQREVGNYNKWTPTTRGIYYRWDADRKLRFNSLP